MEFINPNWHIILIHLPLGVFALGVVIELLSFLWRESPVRIVARGMIWIGALSCIPAAVTGIYAFADVVRMNVRENVTREAMRQPWHETVQLANAQGMTPDQWEHLGQHAWAQGVATGVAVIAATIAFGLSDHWRRKLQLPIMGLLLFSLIAMIWGAYFGGEMVYKLGTGVIPAEVRAATASGSALERVIPPLQLHVLLAGLTVAAAFAALGLSMRVMSTADQWRDPEVGPARSLLDLEASPRSDADLDLLRSLNPDADTGAGPAGIPSARFWLIAALLGLLTALAGIWFLARPAEVNSWSPAILWNAIEGKQRRLFHVIAGVSIVVLTLILALCARFARRSKFLLGTFSLLLLIAVAAQVWLGVLMMFDTQNGPPTRFNQPVANDV